MSESSAAEARRTPREILAQQERLKPNVVAVRVDGELGDLHTPVSEGARIEPVLLGDEDALDVIRHSSAHVLADAVQRLYPGTRVTFGPATEDGFYYDFDRRDGQFSEADFERIEQTMREIIAQDLPFRREVVDREQARAVLQKLGEHYKIEHLDRLQGEISLYRHGDWVDLCEGPHVPSTGYLRAVKLTTVSGAYWRGDERNPMLQRIYGTAFASKKELDAHLKAIEEAKKRDHRKLGRELELIGFHKWAPASPFFLPRGAFVYNRLIDYVRELYDRYGYHEVVTPQVFGRELFEQSGHLPGFAENVFFASSLEGFEQLGAALAGDASTDASAIERKLQEESRYVAKPMNCPGHCLMFAMTRRSYRELPMRVADFGRLHRFERSGVTQGLTRVRTFCQDDAHIFCTEEQVQEEIVSFVDLVHEVYRDFGFADVRTVIATRPDERLGEEEVWDRAEAALRAAVESRGLRYDIADGEGAFYGPKIEFHLKDALGRPWQLGTIQADFNLPERFNLQYIGPDNVNHRPVMLHRAVLGSIERFYAVLVEHVAGAFPVWLAPEQVAVLPVSDKVAEYGQSVHDKLRRAGVRATLDTSADKLGAKIRGARSMRIPYLAVVGAREADAGTVAVRSRDEDRDLGAMSLDALVDRVRGEALPPSRRHS